MGSAWSSQGGAKLPQEIKSLKDQSKAVKDAPPATRGSYFMPNDDFYLTPDPKVTTLYENFLHGVEASKNGDCLGHRPSADADQYVWMNYEDVHQQAKKFGAALLNAGLKHGVDSKLGIYAVNSPEWVMASLGAMTQGMVIVPLYDTLGTEAVTHIVNQAEIQVVVCDNYKKTKALLDNHDALPTIQTIIIIQETSEGADTVDQLAREKEVQLVTFKAFVQSAPPMELHLPKPDDLFILCYTSGTTGTPKGVMLTHKNVLSMSSCVTFVCDKFGVQPAGPGKKTISYLPLAHIFEQAVHVYLFFNGGQIGFYRGDTLTLLDDIKVLKPEIFPVVPRLLGKLYDKVTANVAKAGAMGQFLFKQGYNAKLGKLKQGIVTKDTIWDRLIFKKLQAEIGGNVEFMVVGAAPTSAEVLELCRVALGCHLLEGYGQTECAAACSLTLLGEAEGGQVGVPLPCNHITLMDVPEMQYYAKDNKGEICIRGANVMQGYYKDPEKTVEALDDDGWLHTGDVGHWLPNGTLKVIDRKKHIFKLSQGEYVAPEKIEQVYQRMPLVAQIYVDGNSTERYLVGVVVPEQQTVTQWASTAGLSIPDFPSLCQDPSLQQHLLKEMNKFSKTAGLSSFEQVKAIHVTSEEFTVENDLLTPTLKSKRPQLRNKYKETIDKLYLENNNDNTKK